MKHVTVGQEYLKNHDWLLMTFSVKGLNSKRGQFFQNMNPNIPCEFLNNLGGGGGKSRKFWTLSLWTLSDYSEHKIYFPVLIVKPTSAYGYSAVFFLMWHQQVRH